MFLGRSIARIFGLFLLLFAGSPVLAETDQERAEALFQEGYTLYQQYSSRDALIRLKEAAKLGHAEAAHYAGNILLRGSRYLTDKVEELYRQAAGGGEIYAMLRLSQKSELCGTLRSCGYGHKKWLYRAKDLTLPKAEAGDVEAMKALYSIYRVEGDESEAWEWIQRAAKGGHAFSQYRVAILLDQWDMGFYWTEEGRREDVLKWLRASAERGFPKAILKLAVELKEDGRFEESHEWVDRMGQTDYFDALFNYGLILLDGPDGMFQYPETKSVEGLAVLLAIYREHENSAVERSISRAKMELSSKVIAEAEKRAEELFVDRPVIYYRPKFDL